MIVIDRLNYILTHIDTQNAEIRVACAIDALTLARGYLGQAIQSKYETR